MILSLKRLSQILTIITILITTSVLCFASSKSKASPSIAPYFNLVWTQDDSNIELGIELKRKNKFTLRITGRVPLEKDSNPQFSQIDSHTDNWRIGCFIYKEWDTTRKEGPTNTYRLGIKGYWGYSKFKYFPNGGNLEDSQSQHSFSAAVNFGWFHTSGRSGGLQISPQLKILYARDWEASDEIGIVIPGEGDSPSTVKDKIISPPKTIPKIFLQVAMPFYTGSKLPIGFGPSLGLIISGSDRDWFPKGAATRLRSEFWIYWFPIMKEKTNVRLGLAPFLDSRVGGSDELDKNVYGVLLQMRIGVTLLEY